MKNFVLIGASGYIAPRHMKAIKDTGNNLIAAFDPYDGIGIMDSFFPDASFFTEFERFDRYLDMIKRNGQKIDYVCVCSPNYLHDAHIRFGLKLGSDVICEKPIVLNPWNVNSLIEVEKETSNKINAILQLRLHPSIISLRDKIINSSSNKSYNIELKYITSRGKWYHHSWKGDYDKSGGILSNIGIHFFDMLIWIFGNVIQIEKEFEDKSTAKGVIVLEKAKVNWFLSVDYENIPEHIKNKGLRTYRSLKIENEEIEFSSGFTDLHTQSYERILKNESFSLKDTYKAIELVSKLREL
ncbi:MAG: oxidoreductase [Gammaproteobacteria bacterium]|nr:oxidoreductase [Gammaproteobacteria bacterium]|tara:strand:+ start:2836 stop:3729 length:894 start_codon:yes stop_codon:yes gene_type:complete